MTGKVRQKIGEYRIGFMLECALAITGYKLQGRNETSVKIYMKDFAHVPGLFNVGCSRVRSPKDNHISSGEWPSVLDINTQRLNSYVPEAEIFERVIKIMSLKTVAKLTIETGVSYGHDWSKEEYAVLEDLSIALRSDSAINSTSIQSFIFTILGKKYCLKDIESILTKIEDMPGLRVKLPYLTHEEWRKLNEHKKKKRRKIS